VAGRGCLALADGDQLLLQRFWIRKELALEQAPRGRALGPAKRHQKAVNTQSAARCRSISPETVVGFTGLGNPSRALMVPITKPAGSPSAEHMGAGGSTRRLFTGPAARRFTS